MTDEEQDAAIAGILGILGELSAAMAALAAVSAHTVKGEVPESAEAFQVFAARFEKAVESHAAIAERFRGSGKPN
jgi:hypothetical protein